MVDVIMRWYSENGRQVGATRVTCSDMHVMVDTEQRARPAKAVRVLLDIALPSEAPGKLVLP